MSDCTAVNARPSRRDRRRPGSCRQIWPNTCASAERRGGASPPEVHDQEPAAPGAPEIGGHRLPDVRARDVGRDDEAARRLHGLVAAPAVRRECRHRDAVLAAVHGDAEGHHDVVHRDGGVEECRPLARQLGRPHPVPAALHVGEGAHPRPDELGAPRLRSAAPCGRVDQSLIGCSPMAWPRRDTEVALRHDRDIGHGQLERPQALLAGQQARDAAVHLGRQERFDPTDTRRSTRSSASRTVRPSAGGAAASRGAARSSVNVLLRQSSPARSRARGSPGRAVPLVVEDDLPFAGDRPHIGEHRVLALHSARNSSRPRRGSAARRSPGTRHPRSRAPRASRRPPDGAHLDAGAGR